MKKRIAVLAALSGLAMTAAMIGGAGVSLAATNPNPATVSHTAKKHPHRHRPFLLFRHKAMTELSQFLHLTPKQLAASLKKGQSLDAIAAGANVSQTSLLAELQTIVNAPIQQRVSAGHLSPSKAGAREQKIDAKLPKIAASARLWRPAHQHRRRSPLSFDLVAQAAKALNMTPKQLLQSLHSGQSMAQVAASKGISAQTLATQIESSIAQSVDQAVPKLLDKTWKAHSKKSTAPAG